jgi:hypothetical protein
MKNRTVLLNSICVATLFAISFSSCKKDEPESPSTSTASAINPGDGVFVTDEGNFMGGNGKVSFYRYSDGTATLDMFAPINARPLGDVCQSMTLINGKEYVVVNNSGKIEVCDPSNMRSTATISGFTSPRFIFQVSPTKAYVSDLYANAISIVNLSNNTRTGSISFPGASENMVMVGNEIFVTSTDHGNVYVVNANTDALVDSIAVTKGGNSMQLDNSGKLWVLTYGDYFTSTAGAMYRINTGTHSIEATFPFTSFDYPTKLCANSTGDTLYFLNYSVYRFPSSAAALPSTPFIAATTQSFYGLGIRPGTGEVFVTDAVDYTQRGHLLRYSSAGALTNDKLVGIIPGGVYFY